MPKRPLAWICAASLVICLHGCSFLFVQSAPPDHATRPYFSCTSSRVAPIFDTIGAGTTGLSALMQATLGEASDRDRSVGTTVSTFAFAVILGASAAVGYWSTSDCSEALRARDARVGLPVSPLLPTTPPSSPDVPGAPVTPVPAAPAAPIPPHEAPVLLFGEPTPPPAPAVAPVVAPPAPTSPPSTPSAVTPAPPQPTP